MALNKFKNEKRVIIFFLVSSIVVFILSGIFLYSSTLADEMGGIFISAMLLFISGYGAIVFIKRLIKYRFLKKMQNAIMVENIRLVSSLQSKFGKNKKRLLEDIKFMVNGGYLGDLKLRGEEALLSDKEIAEQKEIERAKFIKQTEIQAKEIIEKKETKGSKKHVINSQKCPNCGAKINFDTTNETSCPYCGNILTRQ